MCKSHCPQCLLLAMSITEHITRRLPPARVEAVHPKKVPGRPKHLAW